MDEVLIGRWRFRPDLHLLEDGELRHHLEPKQAAVLSLLAARAGALVSKTELLDTVWNDVVVGDEVLTNTIYQLRRSLGDSARRQVYIRTIPKKGYMLVLKPAVQSQATRPLRWPARTTSLAATIALLGILVLGAMLPGSSNDIASHPVTPADLGPDVPVLRTEQEAVAHNPDSAGAWADLADARLKLVIRGEVSSAIGLPPAEEDARRAIALDPRLAEPWITLGQVAMQRWEWTAATAAMEHAVELDPDSGRAHAAYAELLLLTGRSELARGEANLALQLAPDTRRVLLAAGFVYTMLRDREAAVEAYHRALDLDPADAVARSQLQKLEREEPHPARGEITADRIDQILQKDPLRPAIIAGMFAEAGEDARALEWLRRARDQKDLSLLLVRLDDRWTRLRDDPRYRELMDVGL